ncbi:tyrosine--tRNA ligase [Magnetococcales bacterium HHB-1]
MNLFDDLTWRGTIFQSSGAEAIQDYLSKPARTVYAGFDPTAISLHVGNLIPLLALRRFQMAGHIPIALLGGGTGLIGDPSGKSNERSLNNREIVEQWITHIGRQLAVVLDTSEGSCQARIVNNHDWLSSLSLIDYLRDVGKHFSIGAMLGKESVRSRIENAGISYTEFSYMVLQAFDYLHLAKYHDCLLQIGGSDQWGNITAGMDLIRRQLSQSAHALTFPLLTTSSGKKFGKSEGNAIWLDANLTSPYEFYQFWLNVEDADVIRFYKLFSLAPQEIIAEHIENAEENLNQLNMIRRLLAKEMTTLIHGKTECDQAINASQALFGRGDLNLIDQATLTLLSKTTTSCHYHKDKIPPIEEILVDLQLCPSRSKARQLVASGGLYINNQRRTGQVLISEADFLHHQFMVVRRGKKAFAMVTLT